MYQTLHLGNGVLEGFPVTESGGDPMKSKGGDSGGGNGVFARERKPLLMAWRGFAAWRYLLFVGIVIASPGFSRSDTLHFAIDPAITGVPITGIGATSLFSSDLNGTVVAGQSLSLDLVFNDGELARLFLIDPQTFGIELIVYTNAGTFPGFSGPTTGFLLDPNGNQIGGSQVAGRSDSSNGSLSMGLVQFTSANLGGAAVTDISGVHFDTTFPNTGFVVTNSQMAFVSQSQFDAIEFGTAQQLPEPSTLGLTLIGVSLFALAALRGKSR